LRLAENLSGQGDDPVSLSWEDICKDDLLSEVTTLTPSFEVSRLYLQAFNAYVLNDLSKAEMALKKLLSRKPKERRYPGSHFINYFFVFVDGVVSAALYRKKKSRRYRLLLDDAIKWLVTASKKGSVNCLGMLRFLEAEKNSTMSSAKPVDMELYAKAISLLARGGFIHFCAIANERMGESMLRNKDMYWAAIYFTNAVTCYKDWGAKLKVEQLVSMYDFVLNRSDDRCSGLLHGRRRFSMTKHSLDNCSLKDVLSSVRSLNLGE
jgi:hypothetical protein